MKDDDPSTASQDPGDLVIPIEHPIEHPFVEHFFTPPIRFGAPPVLLVGFAVFICFVAGTHLFNWTPWEKILKARHIYSDLCPDPTVVCDKQEARIASLIAVVTVSMFTMTFIGGWVLDLAGPRVSCFLGLILMSTGWILLLTVENKYGLLLPALILISAGVDPIFFGLLCIANLFPGHEAAIIAALGGGRSLSALLPTIFLPLANSGKLSLKWIGVIMLCSMAVCATLVQLFVPVVPYRHGVRMKGEDSLEEYKPMLQPLDHPEDLVLKRHKAPVCAAEEPKFNHLALAHTGAAIDTIVATSRTVRLRDVGRSLTDYALYKWDQFKDQLLQICHLVPSPLYWLVCIVSIVNMIRNNWLLASASKQMTPAGLSYFGIVNSLAFIIGPIMGVVVDLCGPIFALLVLQITNGITTVSLMLSQLLSSDYKAHNAFSYVAATFALPGIGFLLSQVYCYMAVIFPPEHMGKLVGIACILSGLVAMISTPLYKWALYNNTFWVIDLAICGATAITFVIVLALWPLLKRRKRHEAEQRAAQPPIEYEFITMAPDGKDTPEEKNTQIDDEDLHSNKSTIQAVSAD